METIRIVRSVVPSSGFGWILRYLAVFHAILPAGWPPSINIPPQGATFDFVVVGAGSAGAIVASRLAEVPHWRVLLVEAGGNPPFLSVLPSTFGLLAHTRHDWDYQANLDVGVGQAHPHGTVYLTRGKMLGGSSSNNYEIYARGKPADYDEWNEIAPGWDWTTALHYFKKLENMTDPEVIHDPETAYLHSNAGPVAVSRPESNDVYDEISRVYLESLQEIGIPTTKEINGPEIVGASTPHFTFANGRRSSTAEAYLIPAKKRPNFSVIKNARATKVLIDPYTKQAQGVELLLASGRRVKVHARIEVIISAGAIDTPKLLMLSGIGPAEELEKHEIHVIADLPVGKNLHDHQITPIIFKGKRGLKSSLKNLLVVREVDRYPVPLQSGFFKVKSKEHSYFDHYKPQFQIFNTYIGAAAYPAIMFGCKFIVNYDDQLCRSIANINLYNEFDMTQLVLLHPLSRGQVRLRSKNPLDDPIIDLGYYRDERDIDLTVKGLKYMLRLINTSYYRKVKGSVGRLKVTGCEGKVFGTDEYWRCYVKNVVTSLLHPVGTCAMGADGVVDERLRVHGVSRLRVVDASIMPKITSGNTNAPAMMIGERAADLIKEEYLNIVSIYKLGKTFIET